MQAPATRLTGTGAGAKKYDVLSALALAGLDNSALPSQRALRFIALITIRYNWAADVLSVGHAELERLWSVSKRTVIREMDALRGLGLLVVLRPGRKGKVTTYRLDIAAVRKLAAADLSNETTGIDARLSKARNKNDSNNFTDCSVDDDIKSNDRCDRDSKDGIWETIIDRLPSTVSIAQRTRWLIPERVKQVGTTLEVELGSAFRAEYVARTYGDQLQTAARYIGITRVNIVGEFSSIDADAPTERDH
jgi:hypothetical protein